MADERRRIPVPSGCAYRVSPLPECAWVTPTLACELATVLEHFARDAGFSAQRPVVVSFRPGVVGHHQAGRAADIYGVDRVGLDEWKRRWDTALQKGDAARARHRNLGWRLYKALQCYGRWAQPYGYPIQLFGPWTRTEGPWKYISERLLRAHHDHIHVAK